ncbi:unnamed protein product [Aspergillus oryzae]|nr:unnamed protein product [Aspergillus oryzae]
MHANKILSTLALFLTGSAAMHNANHIFNAIHASMRLWGSSLHHNGMSFFLAAVPEGIQLYHGNARSDPIEKIGWMAFEPDHAMVFARPSRRPSPSMPSDQHLQHTMAAEDSPADDSGFLHTFLTAKELRLVYIDGTSAGKSRIGTLDSQDRILFNDTLHGGVGMEDQRAKAVCRIAQTEWEGRVDGVIRMAAGFEIILCDPEVNLVPVQVTQVRHPGFKGGPNKGGKGKPKGKPGELLRAVTSRFHGIGGERVRVHYDHFVTAYSYDLDLFTGDSKLPRLAHLSSEELQPIRDNLTQLVLTHDANYRSVNWQAVADLIVEKYGRFLHGLLSRKHHHGDSDLRESIVAQIDRLMAPFIDVRSGDEEQAIKLCSTQFVPLPTGNSPLAQRALYAVNHRICSALIAVRNETEPRTMVSTIRELMDYLDWTVWKECRGYRDDEFCAIPIWPQGSQRDYHHPRPQKYDEAYQGENDYWGPVWD